MQRRNTVPSDRLHVLVHLVDHGARLEILNFSDSRHFEKFVENLVILRGDFQKCSFIGGNSKIQIFYLEEVGGEVAVVALGGVQLGGEVVALLLPLIDDLGRLIFDLWFIFNFFIRPFPAVHQ